MYALFRFVCLAYPKDFRARYFRQIVGDFELHQAEQAGGFAYTLQMIWDVLLSGLRLRAEIVGRDVSMALRRLRQSPLLVTIVVITFALGIGANLTVFSVLNTVLLQPLPYPNAARLVSIRIAKLHGESYPDSFSVPDLWSVRTRAKTLENATGFWEGSRTLTGYGKPVTLNELASTWRFFDTLGVKPELGRFPAQADGERTGAPAVVISDAMWRGRFHAEPQIVGKSIMLDGVASTVIGVAPRGFEAPEPFGAGYYRPDVYAFISEKAPANMRGSRFLFAIGLMRPNVSVDAARADVLRVYAQMQREYPQYETRFRPLVDSLRDAIVGGSAPALLWMIFCAVLGVFVIMCANVASLLLTQSNARLHELSMRMALGASRRRIIQQLLTESGVLALIGGIVGVGIAYASLHEFARLGAGQLPRLSQATIDLPVLLYGTGIVILAALLAGAVPAWMLASSSAVSSVRGASRSGAAANRRLQSALVVAEIAIALSLVTASGLALRSFHALTHADIGVRQSGVLLTDMYGVPDRRYPAPEAKAAFEDRLLQQLQAIPGVTPALAISYPMGDALLTSTLDIRGKSFSRLDAPTAVFNAVSPAYFNTMGVRLQRGRLFTADDSAGSAPVAVVSASFAKYLSAGEPLVGKHVLMQLRNRLHPGAWMTIVGVVGDTRNGPTAPVEPEVYVPLAQTSNNWVAAVAYVSHGDAAAVRNDITSAFARVDPLSQPPPIYTYPELMADSANAARLSAALFTALGIIALCLAVAGVFGVVSYSVSQRQAEFGIRMAVGSTPGAILANVLAGVGALLGLGLAIGLVLAALAGRAISPQLYEVQAIDVPTLVAVTALLACTALLAGTLPALRAARVDPARTLRYE